MAAEAMSAPASRRREKQFQSVKWMGFLTRLIEILLGGAYLFFLASLVFGDMIYFLGEGFLVWLCELIFMLLAARCVMGLPWRGLRRLAPPALATAVATIGFLALIQPALTSTLPGVARRLTGTRIAFKGLNDDRIMAHLTEFQYGYPRRSFVVQAQSRIPEGDTMLYVGDQRAHIVSYLLYPRKLYMLPELQEILLKTSQLEYITAPDPALPATADRIAGYGQEQTRRKLDQLIQERQIHWLLWYDTLDSSRSLIRKFD